MSALPERHARLSDASRCVRERLAENASLIELDISANPSKTR